MGGYYFVSYSRAEAEQPARRLADNLIAGPPSYPVWLDVRDMQPGQDWDKQIRDAIARCDGLLFVMTRDSVQDYSSCEHEWTWALKCKKPVIPLRLEAGARLPFRLSSRQYIDFSNDFDIGLARLRGHFGWLTTPAGALQDLRMRLAEAERELPRARDEAHRVRITKDIGDLRQRITAQEESVADPTGSATRTTERIGIGLEGEREPEPPESKPVRAARARFVNTPPVIAPHYFQDRHLETELLSRFLRSDDARLMTVVGRGGIGKTAMVCRLLKELERGRLPDDLGELTVDGIVYLRTPSAHPVNFYNFFTDLCRLLPAATAERLLQRYRDPHESRAHLMATLLDAFPAGCSVVLLDNFEDLIDPGTLEIVDAELDDALRALLSAPAHGIKVVLTTRVAPQSLMLHQPGVQQRINLDEGLPSPYAEQLLRARDPDGTLGLRDAPESQLSQARERTGGYPRALEALAAILSADRNTTLPELLDQTATLPDNVVEAVVGQAFHRLDPLAQQIMQAVAVYPVPVPVVAIDFLLQSYQPAIDAAPTLARLVNMQFVRRDAGRYYLHQVDRDYAFGRIAGGQPGDYRSESPPFTQHALRDRAADYFVQIRIAREVARTLDDLAPQLAEFELRCQNKTYDAAAPVLFTIDFDYLMRWGHYRFVVDLHSRLEGNLTDPHHVSSSKNSLGEAYRTLGEFPKAIENLEGALAISQEIGDLSNVARRLGNLGNCHFELGVFPRAIELYDQSVSVARQAGDQEAEANNLGNLGNCHANQGEIARAIELYELALSIHQETHKPAGEAADLSSLGSCHAERGETARAIELYEQALIIDRKIQHRYGEAGDLTQLAWCHAGAGEWARARNSAGHAVEIADAIGSAQLQASARLILARAHLLAGDLAAAREVIEEAREHPHPAAQPDIAVMSGAVHLRQGAVIEAERAFHAAITGADTQLRQAPLAYGALDTKAVALAGLTLVGSTDHIAEASAAFRAARAIVGEAGIVTSVRQSLEALAPADRAGALEPLRALIAGYER